MQEDFARKSESLFLVLQNLFLNKPLKFSWGTCWLKSIIIEQRTKNFFIGK